MVAILVQPGCINSPQLTGTRQGSVNGADSEGIWGSVIIAKQGRMLKYWAVLMQACLDVN